MDAKKTVNMTAVLVVKEIATVTAEDHAADADMIAVEVVMEVVKGVEVLVVKAAGELVRIIVAAVVEAVQAVREANLQGLTAVDPGVLRLVPVIAEHVPAVPAQALIKGGKKLCEIKRMIRIPMGLDVLPA